MGCHTWFYRTLSKDEIENTKQKAIEMANDLCGDTEENREYGFVNINLLNDVLYSIKNNTSYWVDNGWGFKESVIKYKNKYYISVDDFHDIFRIINYPEKVTLKGFKNTLKFLKKKNKQYNKKYGTSISKHKIDVEITDEKIRLLKEFFKKYPSGIIKFG